MHLAAKQAEFEESIRLKNQFKSLDEDDVDFLDSVLESERAKEDAVRRETAEQLDAYRKQQAAAQKVDLEATKGDATSPSVDADSWVMKKRRRKELDNPVSKLRKTSPGTKPVSVTAPVATTISNDFARTRSTEQRGDVSGVERRMSPPSPVVTTPAAVSQASVLGLGVYSSDED